MSKNFDQIRTEAPLATVDGTETFIVNKGGVTSGGFLSILKAYVLAGFEAVNITNSTTLGRGLITAAAASDGRTLLEAAQQRTAINQADAEAGTATIIQDFTAQRVRQAIASYSDPKRRNSIVLTATTTVSQTHTDRTVICDSASAFDINFPDSGTTFGNKETVLLVNLGTADVTLKGGSSLKKKGDGTVTSYILPVNGIVRAYSLGSNAWFLEA